jgi:hypothetical protein
LEGDDIYVTRWNVEDLINDLHGLGYKVINPLCSTC